MAITNTGKGKDRMGGKNDGLRYDWRWAMRCQLSGYPQGDKRRLPCQGCIAEIQTALGPWEFEALDWHDSYEAQAKLKYTLTLSEKGLPSRLAAQRRAEAIVAEFCERVRLELG